jgi:hypothetical protein
MVINITCYIIIAIVVLWTLSYIFSKGVILFCLAVNFIKELLK